MGWFRVTSNPQASIEQIQSVGGIVHVVEALARDRHQSEQSARSGRVSAAVQQLLLDLITVGCSGNQETIVPVRRQNIATRRNGQTEDR